MTSKKLEKLVISSDNISFIESASVKTNFLILFKWLKNLVLNFNQTIEYMDKLEQSISDKDLVKTVLDKIHEIKIMFEINLNVLVNSSDNFIINDVSYTIQRSSETEYIITKTVDSWTTDNLIVQVKLDTGEIVYPVIKTSNGNISINFDKGFIKNNNSILKVYIM